LNVSSSRYNSIIPQNNLSIFLQVRSSGERIW
jgi:hypothetical protein